MPIENKVMLITYPDSLGKNLKELENKDVDTLLDERYNKFRKIGKVNENVIKK